MVTNKRLIKKIRKACQNLQKNCSVCDYKNKELTLADRFWTCPECSEYHDRDKNASENIKRVGASTLEVEDIRAVSTG